MQFIYINQSSCPKTSFSQWVSSFRSVFVTLSWELPSRVMLFQLLSNWSTWRSSAWPRGTSVADGGAKSHSHFPQILQASPKVLATVHFPAHQSTEARTNESNAGVILYLDGPVVIFRDIFIDFLVIRKAVCMFWVSEVNLRVEVRIISEVKMRIGVCSTQLAPAFCQTTISWYQQGME